MILLNILILVLLIILINRLPTTSASFSDFKPVICNLPFAKIFILILRNPQYFNFTVV